MAEKSSGAELCQGAYWTPNEGRNKMQEFEATWAGRDSWGERAKLIRGNLLAGLQWERVAGIDAPFDPIVHSRREMDGYVVENIAIRSFPGYYITGNLYLPTKIEGRVPAVLNPHGHVANKRLTDYLQRRCAGFARLGAIAFTYDMLGYGESTQVTHDIPIAALLQTWNSKRVLDYLVSRSDVDSSRIGVTGGSGGGTQTFLLTAIDDRITASAPVVQVSAHFFGGCGCESGMPIHRRNGFQTNNVEIAALAAPRPLLLISNGADWTRFTPLVEYPYLCKVYALYKAEHLVENIHLPLEAHDYGYSKRAGAFMFFAHHLNLGWEGLPYQDGKLDESYVTLLPPEELRVFDARHPRPSDALSGDAAVMRALGFA